MKRILLTIAIFIAMVTVSNAGELYSCIDRDGNRIITDSPQDGMKNCVLKASYEEPTPEEREQLQKEKAQKQLEKSEEYNQRQANSRQEESIRKENEQLQEKRNKAADRLELEAQRMQRGTPELDAIRSCTMTNVARIRAGEPTTDCDHPAVEKSKNKRLCENDCGNEKLTCMGECMGNAACINRCANAHFRCLDKCKY